MSFFDIISEPHRKKDEVGVLAEGQSNCMYSEFFTDLKPRPEPGSDPNQWLILPNLRPKFDARTEAILYITCETHGCRWLTESERERETFLNKCHVMKI